MLYRVFSRTGAVVVYEDQRHGWQDRSLSWQACSDDTDLDGILANGRCEILNDVVKKRECVVGHPFSTTERLVSRYWSRTAQEIIPASQCRPRCISGSAGHGGITTSMYARHTSHRT